MIENIEQKIDVEIVYALLSGKITHAMNRTLKKKLKDSNIDITPAQVAVLYTLWHKNGISQREIARQVTKDMPSITRLLDDMDKRGLITRKQDAQDRRSNLIFLTDKAEVIKEGVRNATIGSLQDGFKGLSVKNITDVQRLMKIIFNNLGGNSEENDTYKD
ncbi:MAG: MarR family transcriptional regulator [Paludibacteraceae bacterium]|nr:MarR family transcriptional regulator [Paludibacteraceae bacterium]